MNDPDRPGRAPCSVRVGITRRRGRRAGVLAGCLGIGLLLWARLILVSDMPRMALAETEASNAQGATDPTPPGAEGAAVAGPAEGGADADAAGAEAPPAPADSARSSANFPDPHNRDSFTAEHPKSRRNPSD